MGVISLAEQCGVNYFEGHQGKTHVTVCESARKLTRWQGEVNHVILLVLMQFRSQSNSAVALTNDGVKAIANSKHFVRDLICGAARDRLDLQKVPDMCRSKVLNSTPRQSCTVFRPACRLLLAPPSEKLWW